MTNMSGCKLVASIPCAVAEGERLDVGTPKQTQWGEHAQSVVCALDIVSCEGRIALTREDVLNLMQALHACLK